MSDFMKRALTGIAGSGAMQLGSHQNAERCDWSTNPKNEEPTSANAAVHDASKFPNSMRGVSKALIKALSHWAEPCNQDNSAGTDNHYTIKEGVTISDSVKQKIVEIANSYHEATGKDLVITDGSRTSYDQASAMYNNIHTNPSDFDKYTNQTAATEIKEAYQKGIKENHSKEEIITSMQHVIDTQISKGVYISKHLTDGAFDVRSSNMTENDKAHFQSAVEGAGGTVLPESDHLHVQIGN